MLADRQLLRLHMPLKNWFNIFLFKGLIIVINILYVVEHIVKLDVEKKISWVETIKYDQKGKGVTLEHTW